MNRESSSLSPPTYRDGNAVLREWLSGRASPCQGESRGFDPRLPLQTSGTVHGKILEYIKSFVMLEEM